MYTEPTPGWCLHLQVVGGHHDAGDYGKYVINSGSLVGWLMNSLEILGADNDDLALPEAGDGVPDIAQVRGRLTESCFWFLCNFAGSCMAWEWLSSPCCSIAQWRLLGGGSGHSKLQPVGHCTAVMPRQSSLSSTSASCFGLLLHSQGCRITDNPAHAWC